jgi:hypothetical protein
MLRLQAGDSIDFGKIAVRANIDKDRMRKCVTWIKFYYEDIFKTCYLDSFISVIEINVPTL